MQIVDAQPEHLDGIARIYRHYVENTAITFDLLDPDPACWREQLGAVDPEKGHFFIVAVDDDGAVLGYAKSGKFRDRAAYDTTCETSIYVDTEAQGRGIGKALYGRLIELLEASPARLAVGGMTEPNPASAALHQSLGFTRVGTFEAVGTKFDKPWAVTWFQRPVS
jgi:phosphinothricin acetyltransferase